MAVKNMTICIVYAPKGRTVLQHDIVLPVGSTVQHAIDTLALPKAYLQKLFTDSSGGIRCGIWGKKACLDTTLQDGDRVELYRALLVDPKTARRLRFTQQGSRAAGLFAARRNKKTT